MHNVIITDHLTKRYGPVLAVDGLSIQVRQGELYGFLGLNGAGKTTTIRLLLGMLRPTAGAACLFGQPVAAGAAALWARTGYLVEAPYAYPELTVRENLDAARRLRRVTDPHVVERIIEQLALGPYAHRRAGTLSQGNAQRLGLAKALLHRPDLLLLDEPANALDPAGVVEIRELLRRLAVQDGVTILMSSHILTEVARLATRIGVVHGGRLVEELDSAQLDARLRRRLIVGTLDVPGALTVLTRGGFAPTPGGAGRLVISDPAAVDHPERVADLLAAAGVPLTLLNPQQEDLETHFLRLVNADGGNG